MWFALISILFYCFYYVIAIWFLLLKEKIYLLDMRRKSRAVIIHIFHEKTRTFSLYSCTLISKLEIILGLHCISKEAWFYFVFILNNILLSFVFCKLLWYQNFSLIFFFQLVSATICLLLIVWLLKLQSYNLEKFK